MMEHNFAVFIPSYGRADTISTYRALVEAGYTGTVYVVCDDTDKQLDAYKDHFDNVLVFSKAEYYDLTDTMDNFRKMNTVTYARNAIYDFADELGVEYFAMIDDDIESISYRLVQNNRMLSVKAFGIDRIFDAVCEMLDSDSVYAITFTRDGMYFGGLAGIFYDRCFENLNQCFCLKTSKRIRFSGTFNEDENALCQYSKHGKVLMSATDISIKTCQRGENKGGLHDIYAEGDSYNINYYTIITAPACYRMYKSGGEFKLKRNKVNLFPKIIDERWRR